MELLRNKSSLTRMQILLTIVLEHPPDQRSISDVLKITPQAVSEYLRKMETDDLVNLSDKGPRATVKGVDILQRSLLQLKEYVDASISSLSIIRSTDAVAFMDIDKDSEVGLFMYEGLLHAGDPDGRGSRGYADHAAKKGDMVSISSLSGVLDMEDPAIFKVKVRPARQGGGSDVLSTGKFQAFLKDRGWNNRSRTAVLDIEAAALLKRSGIGYSLELPYPDTIINHLERGISLVLVGTPFSLSSVIKKISIDGDLTKIHEIGSEELLQ